MGAAAVLRAWAMSRSESGAREQVELLLQEDLRTRDTQAGHVMHADRGRTDVNGETRSEVKLDMEARNTASWRTSSYQEARRAPEQQQQQLVPECLDTTLTSQLCADAERHINEVVKQQCEDSIMLCVSEQATRQPRSLGEE